MRDLISSTNPASDDISVDCNIINEIHVMQHYYLNLTQRADATGIAPAFVTAHAHADCIEPVTKFDYYDRLILTITDF